KIIRFSNIAARAAETTTAHAHLAAAVTATAAAARTSHDHHVTSAAAGVTAAAIATGTIGRGLSGFSKPDILVHAQIDCKAARSLAEISRDDRRRIIRTYVTEFSRQTQHTASSRQSAKGRSLVKYAVAIQILARCNIKRP